MSKESNFIEFSKPFIEAAKNVFETMVFTKLDPQKPMIKKDNISKGDVSAVLGLSGEMSKDEGAPKPYKAMLVISWPYETYYKVASAMLMDTFTEYNEEIADVGGEICNMIMGNAKRDLGGMGYTSNMAIPSMIEGSNHTIKYPNGTTVILIPIKSAHGDMFIEICYSESD
jgi:chemotaxis protein CheX